MGLLYKETILELARIRSSVAFPRGHSRTKTLSSRFEHKQSAKQYIVVQCYNVGLLLAVFTASALCLNYTRLVSAT